METKQFYQMGLEIPKLPPLLHQMVLNAPEDFRVAMVLCALPILGTLGSKLRARYLDNQMHSPSFQVSLEAPQASGKSFIVRMANLLLAPVLKRDEEEFMRELDYKERMASKKRTTVKTLHEFDEKEQYLRPRGIIRVVPATVSISKLLMRMENACGLHLFSIAEEIDTVNKAANHGFASYSDLLRVAFDNNCYGQDYVSDKAYSGIVNVYYNTLFSGTAKAVRRFYPDMEDGLVSRVCFVTLPDQFGKPMPVWRKLSERELFEVEKQVERLDRISVVNNVVQPDHVMELGFLNRAMEMWLDVQQHEAVRTGDRTRDTFCRRAAVVGFRAGMLAWFLYGERNTNVLRQRTIDFAQWVANQMLKQHLLRFKIEDSGIKRWEEVYALLGEEFSRDELQRVLASTGTHTPIRQVLYRWQLLGCIKTLEEDRSAAGNLQAVRFKKQKSGFLG